MNGYETENIDVFLFTILKCQETHKVCCKILKNIMSSLDMKESSN